MLAGLGVKDNLPFVGVSFVLLALNGIVRLIDMDDALDADAQTSHVSVKYVIAYFMMLMKLISSMVVLLVITTTITLALAATFYGITSGGGSTTATAASSAIAKAAGANAFNALMKKMIDGNMITVVGCCFVGYVPFVFLAFIPLFLVAFAVLFATQFLPRADDDDGRIMIRCTADSMVMFLVVVMVSTSAAYVMARYVSRVASST